MMCRADQNNTCTVYNIYKSTIPTRPEEIARLVAEIRAGGHDWRKRRVHANTQKLTNTAVQSPASRHNVLSYTPHRQLNAAAVKSGRSRAATCRTRSKIRAKKRVRGRVDIKLLPTIQALQSRGVLQNDQTSPVQGLTPSQGAVAGEAEGGKHVFSCARTCRGELHP